MTAQVTQPNQYITIGTIKLPFPCESSTIDDVVEMYQINYPILADATISSPKLINGELIYTATPPPVKTKGKSLSLSVGQRLVNKKNSLVKTGNSVVVVAPSITHAVIHILKKNASSKALENHRTCLPPF